MTENGTKFLKVVRRDTVWYPTVKYFAIPLIAFAVVVLFFDNIVMPITTRQGNEFKLPSVVGLSLTEAISTLKRAGCTLDIAGEEPDPGIPEGTIKRQTPFAGSRVKRGRLVKVVISAGRMMVNVPGMVGFSQRQSELKLKQAGLSVGTINWTSNDTLPVGVMVYSVPSAGSVVPKDTPVNLYFNQGAQATVAFVPNFVGLNVDDARHAADSLGLAIESIEYAVNANLLPNTVFWQSLDEGTKVESGAAITLRVSVTD